MNHQALEQEAYSKTLFGFWVYLMTDCVLFASLFATFAVLSTGPHDLFSLPFVLAETLLLLVSSFTCGLIMLAAKKGAKYTPFLWMLITFLLGAGFLALELTEFAKLVSEGNSWTKSGYLSAFFTLVGTHGLHITAGLIWMIVLSVQAYFRGFSFSTMRRLDCFRLFWHFLDLVWIFIFTVVYLLGAA